MYGWQENRREEGQIATSQGAGILLCDGWRAGGAGSVRADDITYSQHAYEYTYNRYRAGNGYTHVPTCAHTCFTTL